MHAASAARRAVRVRPDPVTLDQLQGRLDAGRCLDGRPSSRFHALILTKGFHCSWKPWVARLAWTSGLSISTRTGLWPGSSGPAPVKGRPEVGVAVGADDQADSGQQPGDCGGQKGIQPAKTAVTAESVADQTASEPAP